MAMREKPPLALHRTEMGDHFDCRTETPFIRTQADLVETSWRFNAGKIGRRQRPAERWQPANAAGRKILFRGLTFEDHRSTL